jgi:hypothetical protein
MRSLSEEEEAAAVEDLIAEEEALTTEVVDRPRNEGERNWFALPRWMRHFLDDDRHLPHQGEKEKARRIRQMEQGILKEENGARR